MDGVIALLRVMLDEGLDVDADVVHSIILKVSALPQPARVRAYLEALDVQLVQPEQRRERRHTLIQDFYHGLCESRQYELALHVLKLMSEREGCAHP